MKAEDLKVQGWTGMSRINKDALLSPLGICIIYLLASALAVMGFRFILPGEAAPLEIFSFHWRLIRFIIDYIGLFPALALSALVIPFGFKIHAHERINPFSPQFLLSLKMSIVSAIVAAALYGLLYFLVLPMAQDYEANLRFKGRLYRISSERAQEHAEYGEWNEAVQFIAVCESIWPQSPQLTKLKNEAEIHADAERLTRMAPDGPEGEMVLGPGFPQQVNATEALELAETALAEERYFDAHWLATLGGRLAGPGSVEETAAKRLAGMAWSGVNSLAPNARETMAYSIFRLKRDGYEALIAEEWIRSYYIFSELLAITPDDPDALKYISLSENGLKNAAFFIDEMEMTTGTILSGAVFSLPAGLGRIVMKITSLTASTDTAYGIGIEIMTFDSEGRLLRSIEAPYAKFIPLTLDSGPAVAILMRALDRIDKTMSWEPEYSSDIRTDPDIRISDAPPDVQMVLALPWDVFLLLLKIPRGITGLSPADLRNAAKDLEPFGYPPQIFEAELLRRFAQTLFFLPLSILAIVIGWRYRALKRPRYMGIPMLGILPLVFNGAVHFCQGWINNLGIWAIVQAGFTTIAVMFGAGILVLLVLSLIILAAQHG